jgi:hypothetical protein
VAAILRNRVSAAHRRRTGVVQATNRADVLLDAIARKGFDQHECAIQCHGAGCITDGIHRTTHVVQAVEETDQVDEQG